MHAMHRNVSLSAEYHLLLHMYCRPYLWQHSRYLLLKTQHTYAASFPKKHIDASVFSIQTQMNVLNHTHTHKYRIERIHSLRSFVRIEIERSYEDHMDIVHIQRQTVRCTLLCVSCSSAAQLHIATLIYIRTFGKPPSVCPLDTTSVRAPSFYCEVDNHHIAIMEASGAEPVGKRKRQLSDIGDLTHQKRSKGEEKNVRNPQTNTILWISSANCEVNQFRNM